jgi:hypothetical protein
MLDLNEPISLDSPTQDALSAFLVEVGMRMDPFNPDHSMPGYGVNASPDLGEIILKMQRFCWCDDEICPWCSDELEEDYDDETKLRFAASGFVPGHGAPNFRYDDGEFTLSVWWYKYIGRGMKASGDVDAKSFPGIRRKIDAAIETHRKAIALASLACWLDPQAISVGPAFCETLRMAFAARIAAAPDAELDTVISEILAALVELRKMSYASIELALIETHLDGAGIAAFENPDDPEEFRFRYRTSHRVECALFNEGEIPSLFNDEEGVGDPSPVGEGDEEIPF